MWKLSKLFLDEVQTPYHILISLTETISIIMKEIQSDWDVKKATQIRLEKLSSELHVPAQRDTAVLNEQGRTLSASILKWRQCRFGKEVFSTTSPKSKIATLFSKQELSIILVSFYS